MLSRRVFLSTAAAALAAPALAQAKPPIKIGSILPMTGFASSYGILYKAAQTLAVNDLNSAGGIMCVRSQRKPNSSAG